MKKIILLCIWMVLLLSACTPVSTQPRPGSYAGEQQPSLQSPQDQGALFTSDAVVISDAEIQRILGYQVTFPARSRIAILPLGQRTRWSGWSDEFTQLNNQIEEKFIAVLRASPAILPPEWAADLFSSNP